MKRTIDSEQLKCARVESHVISDEELKRMDSVETESALLISVEKASTILGIGRTQTFSLVMQGEISSVKIGRRRLIVRRDLDNFVCRLSQIQNPQ
jgi:excisionase family DNA binding protein